MSGLHNLKRERVVKACQERADYRPDKESGADGRGVFGVLQVNSYSKG